MTVYIVTKQHNMESPTIILKDYVCTQITAPHKISQKLWFDRKHYACGIWKPAGLHKCVCRDTYK